MRFRLAVCAAALLALVSACTSTPDAPEPAASAASAVAATSAPPWNEPAKYDFVLERQCEGGPSMGRYQVAVANGAVVRANRIDGRTASGEEEIDVPSLRELLDLAQTAADDGGEVATTFDATDGHPVTVSFSVSDESADAVSCFKVSDYKPTS